MDRKGHTWAALAFSPLPIASLLDMHPALAAITGLACVSGSSLPDTLEFNRIPHRTFTHILSIWACMAILGYQMATGAITIPFELITPTSSILGAILLGFGCGGVSHWLGDVLNNQPVPVFTPWDKFSLNLFKSGCHQLLSCLFVSLVAWSGVAILRDVSFQVVLASYSR